INSGILGLQSSNPAVYPVLAPFGITPDAALCFILCGISLWALRESPGKGGDAQFANAPVEKFLLEAGLTRASFIKITEDDSENTWDLGSKAAGKDKVEKRRASGFSRRIAQIFASVASVIALIALAGYLLGWDAGVASGNGWLAGMGAILPHLGGQG